VAVDEPDVGAEADPGAAPDAALPTPGLPTSSPAPSSTLNPRQARARRRRRRRRFGTLLFLVVAAAILATAYFAVAGGDGSSDDSPQASGTLVTTTVAPPFVASYKVTSGINVRQAPGTTAPTVGAVEQGRAVTVVCVVEGETVNAATGSSTKWLKVAGSWPVGYVSAAYVLAGDDLASGKIPACPAA